jgi:hypothetical protein
MNAKIMNDSMGILQHNEQKATTRVKTKVMAEWDQFQQIAPHLHIKHWHFFSFVFLGYSLA